MERVINVLKWVIGLTVSMSVLVLFVMFIFYPGYFTQLTPVDASTKTEQVETNGEKEVAVEPKVDEETVKFLRDQAKINARNDEQLQFDTVIIPDENEPVNYTLLVALHIVEEINGNMVTYYLKDDNGVTNIYTTEYNEDTMYGTYSYDEVNSLKGYYPNNIIE